MDILFNAIETIKETTETMRQAREEIVRLQNLNEALLEAAKAALIVIDKTQGADRVGILLAKAIADAEARP